MNHFLYHSYTRIGILLCSFIVCLVGIVNIPTGIVLGSNLCVEHISCSTLEGISLLWNSKKSSEPAISDEVLASIFIKEKDAFIGALENSSLPKSLIDPYLLTLEKQEVLGNILTDLSKEDRIKALRGKSMLLSTEEEEIHIIARTTLKNHFKASLETGKENLIAKNFELVDKIMPKFVNYNDYVRFFDTLQSGLHTPQRPFQISNISVKENAQEVLADTLLISFTIQTTEDTLIEFFKAIGSSGDIVHIPPDSKLLYPFLSIDEAHITYLDTPEDTSSEMARNYVQADCKLIAYLQPVTSADTSAIEEDINNIRSKIEAFSLDSLSQDKKNTFDTLTKQKISYEHEALEAMNQKNYRKAYTAYTNLKQILTDIYKLLS